jgi:integrase
MAPKPHTLAWAIAQYRTNTAWTTLSHSTRRHRERIFEAVLRSAGAASLSQIGVEEIRDGRERRAHTPHAANDFLKAMRGFFAWAVEAGLSKENPTKAVRLLRGPNDDLGFHTWTEEEVAKFESRWPTGTRQRLALDLLLYTGLRRGDVCRVGQAHVTDGVIDIRTEKGTSNGRSQQVFIPILSCLQTSLEAVGAGDPTFILNEYGKPFTKESFGNFFTKACKAAKVPGRAHGLRKIGATRAAENGATERELMAIFGWTTSKMATHYTRTADRKRLALRATELLKRPEGQSVTDQSRGQSG